MSQKRSDLYDGLNDKIWESHVQGAEIQKFNVDD